MRLVYADPHPVPDVTPSTMQMLQNVDAFAQVGVEVTLLTPQPASDMSAEKVLGRPLSSRVALAYLPDLRRRWFFPSSSNKPYQWMARRWLGEHPADALLVRNIKLAEYLLSRDGHPPLYFETHEIFAQTFREDHPQPNGVEARKLAALEARERLVYSKAAGLIAITRALAEDIRSHYGAGTAILVAPDGVDLALADRARRPPPDNDPPVILYLGSLHPWKGVDIAIRAMGHVQRGTLHVAGGSDQRIAELGSLAASLRLAERVRFLGRVEPARRFEAIAAADICVLPSSETSIGGRFTSPLKLFEYMAMAKPIVAADLPALREVLTDGEDALLVAAGDPAAFAAAIDRLVADRALAASLAQRALQAARGYAWTARARRMAGFMAGQETWDAAGM